MGDGELTYLRGLLRPPPAGHSVRGLCAAPVCQELRDERVLVARLDRQRRQRERHGERGVVAERPRRHRARERRMGVVDPDGAVHQPAQFRIGRPRLELHEQTVPRRTPASDHRVERPGRRRDVGLGLPVPGRGGFAFGRRPDLPRAAPPPANGVGDSGCGEDDPSAWLRRRRLPRAARRFLRLRIRDRRAAFANSGAGTRSSPLPGIGSRFCPPARRSTSERSSGKSSARSSSTRSRSRSSRTVRGRASRVARIAPLGELSGDHFLNGLAVGEVRRATRAGPDEVVLAEREARGEIGRLDQPADVRARGRRETEPIPPALDDLAERADRDALALGGQERVSFDEPDGRRRAATAQPD